VWALGGCAVPGAALSRALPAVAEDGREVPSPAAGDGFGEGHLRDEIELNRWSQRVQFMPEFEGASDAGSDHEEHAEGSLKDTAFHTFPAGAWQADVQAMEQFPAALRAIRDRPGTPTKAALLYVQLGPWPPYIKYVVKSAAANVGTTFYFIGPKFEELDTCANCAWLPFDLRFAKTRIQTLLGVNTQDMAHLYPAKLCDLKPMWPTLFPELTSRHEWIGFADHDIIFGDLDAEIDAVREDADLLVPKGFHPQPLANGNLMLFRTTKKMIQAFKGAGNWGAVIRDKNYLGFDEWWGVKPSMMEILVDMHLSGEITAAPTLRPLIQDMTVTHPGGLYGVGMDHNATTQIYWAHGRLAAKRTGTCICPDPNAWVYAFMPLAGCSECMRRTEGGMLPEVLVSRTVEAVGFHFQAWKKKKTWKDCKNKSEGGLQDNCAGWMPDCMEKPGFHFGVRGFSCWGNPPAAAPRTKADEDRSRNLEMQKRRQEIAARQQQDSQLEARLVQERLSSQNQGKAGAAPSSMFRRAIRLFRPHAA